jgi:hypothetical protein
VAWAGAAAGALEPRDARLVSKVLASSEVPKVCRLKVQVETHASEQLGSPWLKSDCAVSANCTEAW